MIIIRMQQQITFQELFDSIEGIQQQHCWLIWREMIQWFYFQFKSDHQINFGSLGNYGCKITKNSHEKIPVLFFNSLFLKQNGLQNVNSSFILKPLVKINVHTIWQNCDGKIDKKRVQNFINFFIQRVTDLILDRNRQNVTINLDLLGKIIRNHKKIKFQYYLPQSQYQNAKGLGLRDIVEREAHRSIIGNRKSDIINNQRLLPKIENFSAIGERNQGGMTQRTQRISSQKRSSRIRLSKLQEAPKTPLKKMQISINSQTKGFSKKRTSSLRALPSLEKALGWQMMSAGKDPLKKDHNYAQLLQDAQQLMKTHFVNRKFQQTGKVPIIDVFSRTLACPVAAQRQNPMSVGRIGTNLSPATQLLDICFEGIRYLRINMDSLQKRAQIQSSKKYIVDDVQEYQIVTKSQKSSFQSEKIRIKMQNFQKYEQLFQMIEQKHIHFLQNSILNKIFQKINERNLNSEGSKALMIEEIVQDYNKSIKKSIIDYILLDPNERERLQVYIQFKNVRIYGQGLPSLKRKPERNFSIPQTKKLLQQNLLKNSPFILKIQNLWIEKFQDQSLIDLPSFLQPFIEIDELVDKQRIRLRQIKGKIFNQWIPSLVQIYKEEISFLGRNQSKCLKFFEAASMMISNQMRSLIQKQIQKYCNFLSTFDKQNPNPADTVVFLEKTQNIYEKCFLNIKLIHKKGQIYFMDSPQEVEKKLLSIVENIRNFSQGIPRPQTFLIKTEKQSLIPLQKTDYFYEKKYELISRIVSKNINNVKGILQLFKNHSFILSESKTIQQWLNSQNHDRRQYSLTFEKYTKLSLNLTKQVPSFIRMNMINVDCSGVRMNMAQSLNNVIRKLQKSVFDLIVSKRQLIQQQLDRILRISQTKIQSCETLVYVEKEVEQFRRHGYKKLMHHHSQLVKWISITLYNTFYVTSSEWLGKIKQTSDSLHKISEILSRQEEAILQKRQDLQAQLIQDSIAYNEMIQQLWQKMEKFKQFSSKMLKNTALALCQKSREQVTKCLNFITILSKKQEILGIPPASSKEVQQISELLGIFENLWALIERYQTCMQTWLKDSIFVLNSKQIQNEAFKMKENAQELRDNEDLNSFSPLSSKMAGELFQELSQFLKSIPIISTFSNPSLKSHHLQKIQTLLSHEISSKQHIHLNKVLALGAEKVVGQLEEISSAATKEDNIQRILNETQQFLSSTTLPLLSQLKENRNSHDEVSQSLQQFHVKLLEIRDSPHIAPFIKQLESLTQKVNKSTLIIRVTNSINSLYKKLYSIMNLPNIMKELSVEGSKFKTVSQIWPQTLEQLSLQPTLSETSMHPLPPLQSLLSTLQSVHKSLSPLLLSKCRSLPRLFLLSDSQLLDLLALGDIQSIGHFLHRIGHLETVVISQGKYIEAVKSKQETILFQNKLNTGLARGNVDQWLAELIAKVAHELRTQTSHMWALSKNKESQINENGFFEGQNGQCDMIVLLANTVFWTERIQSFLLNPASQTSIPKPKIQKIVKKLRDQPHRRTKLLSNLLITAKHLCDICDQIAHKSTLDSNCFQWQSSLKYSLFSETLTSEQAKSSQISQNDDKKQTSFQRLGSNEHKSKGAKQKQKQKDIEHKIKAPVVQVQIRVFDQSVQYGWQYIGTGQRIIATPLTDRCLRNFVSCFYSTGTIMLKGNTCSGKTEIIKQLSNILAYFCAFYSCSSQINTSFVEKFFQGLALSNFWGCWTSFHTVTLETLSLITTKLKQKQWLSLPQKKNQGLFFAVLDLDVQCYMNESRSKQILRKCRNEFRTFHIVNPHKIAILSGFLMMNGFSMPIKNANKIVETLDRITQMFSIDERFICDLRTLKIIAFQAAKLKEQNQNSSSEQNIYIVTAINRIVRCKLNEQQIKNLQIILKQNFGEVPIQYKDKQQMPLLQQTITEVFKENNLSLTPHFSQKMIQLYKSFQQRQGIILVGPSFSSKTTFSSMLLQVLSRTISKGKKQGTNSNQTGNQFIQSIRINPASMNFQQLYGKIIGKQWSDGMFTHFFRKFSNECFKNQNNGQKENSQIKKVIILDGPLNVSWAEKLNSVLDDNKKLCLQNSETIFMHKGMSLIIQTRSLQNCPPSTVVRCGIINVQSIQPKNMWEKWLRSTPWLTMEIIQIVNPLFSMLINLYLKICTNCSEGDNNIQLFVRRFLDNLTVQILKIEKIVKQKNKDTIKSWEKNIPKMLSGLFIFTFYWSLGEIICPQNIKSIDSLIKQFFAEYSVSDSAKKIPILLPQKLDRNSISDYLFKIIDEGTFGWDKWQSPQPTLSTLSNGQLFVFTKNYMKYKYFVTSWLENGFNVAVIGLPGCGKSILINAIEQQYLQKQRNLSQINLTPRITVEEFSSFILTQSLKKQFKNVSHKLIQVQDLNLPLPQSNNYNNGDIQELLSHLLEFKRIPILTCSPPSLLQLKGCQFIVTRSKNNNWHGSIQGLNKSVHANSLTKTTCNISLSLGAGQHASICTAILTSALQGHSEERNIERIQRIITTFYTDMCNCEYFQQLRKQNNVHRNLFTFNFHLVKTLVCTMTQLVRTNGNSENIGRILSFSIARVFTDRLPPSHRNHVQEFLDDIGVKWNKNMRPSFYTRILHSSGEKDKEGKQTNGDGDRYDQIFQLDKIRLFVETSLNSYNLSSENQLSFYAFDQALENILIVHRILNQTRGHGLLVGLEGTGKKTTALLSSYIACIQIVNLQKTINYGLNTFKEDLKKVFRKIGFSNKTTCLLIQDRLIREQKMLDLISNIIDHGYTQNLFTSNEILQICEILRKDFVKQSNGQISMQQVFQFFVSRVKKNVKIILCFNQNDPKFKQRIQLYPTLTTNTVVKWFDQWPDEALTWVANKQLAQIKLKNKEIFIQAILFLHKNVQKWSQVYQKQQKINYLVRSPIFVHFVNFFKQFLIKKRRQNKELIYKYETAFSKIIQIEQKQSQHKQSLQILKPQLKRISQQIQVKQLKLRNAKQQSNLIMEQFAEEQKYYLEATEQVNKVKNQCENQLQNVLPQLKAAEESLLVLDKNSLVQLKSMINPPIAVRLTMQCLCILMDPNPKQKIKNEKTFRMETDWWAASVRLLSNPKLLQQLVNFNKQAISDSSMQNLQKFLLDEENSKILTVENVAKSSSACQCIIQWIYGISHFHKVYKRISPMKESLRLLEQKASELSRKLEQKKNEVSQIKKKVEELQYEYEWAFKNQETIQKDVRFSEFFLKNAQIFLTCLKTQKSKWYELTQKYKLIEKCIQQSLLITSAQIVYFGAFDKNYRNKIIEQWKKYLQQIELEIDSNFSLITFLGDQNQINDWFANGLPEEKIAIENSLIIHHSSRWPFIIDPHSQANKWLKKQYSSKLKISNLNDENFIRTLENCVQFGSPLLIENFPQQFDESLKPIIFKQFYKKGTLKYMRIENNAFVFSQNFRLYISTKKSNIVLSSEICALTTVTNFILQKEQICSFFMDFLMKKQRQDLDDQKMRLMNQHLSNNCKITKIQEEILKTLSKSSNLLNDNSTVESISQLKSQQNEIVSEQKQLSQNLESIKKVRSLYKNAAEEASTIFCALQKMNKVNCFSRYSLEHFVGLYQQAIEKANKPFEVQERVQSLKHTFRHILLKDVELELSEDNHLLFSFIVALEINEVPHQKILNFTKIQRKLCQKVDKPKDLIMNNQTWNRFLSLSEVSNFSLFLNNVEANNSLDSLNKIFLSPNPFEQQMPLLLQNLNEFDKLLFFFAIRKQKFKQSIQNYVEKTIGSTKRIYGFEGFRQKLLKTHPHVPLLVIENKRKKEDSLSLILRQASNRKIQVETLSLDYEQSSIGQRIILQSIQKGSWIIILNCHLLLSWMPKLQQILCDIRNNKKTHRDFRIILTSQLSNEFPESMILNCEKVSIKSAQSAKQILLQIFTSGPMNEQFLLSLEVSNQTSEKVKRLYFSLCFFHSVIKQKIQSFNSDTVSVETPSYSELKLCAQMMRDSIKNNGNRIQQKQLQYLKRIILEFYRVSHLHYQQMNEQLLGEIFCFSVIDPDKQFYFGGCHQYAFPWGIKTHKDFIAYIKKMPEITSPQIMGINNRLVYRSEYEKSQQLLNSICSYFQIAEEKSQSVDAHSIISSILELENFTKYFNDNSLKCNSNLNEVILFEIRKLSKLLKQIVKSTNYFKEVLESSNEINSQLQEMKVQICCDKIPSIWAQMINSKQKSLQGFTNKLKQKCEYFKELIEIGVPQILNLSFFSNPKMLFKAILYDCSKNLDKDINQLDFNFNIQKAQTYEHNGKQKQSSFVLKGISLEDYCWDREQKIFIQHNCKSDVEAFPEVYLEVKQKSKINDEQFFEVPLFQVNPFIEQEQDNHIINLKIPSKFYCLEWTKKCICLFCENYQ